MPETSNNYVFCADYSAMASCLSAIYAEKAAGLYNGEQDLLDTLNTFEHDLLKKLYNRVIRVLTTIEGANDPALLVPGDFDDLDFSKMDFLTGYLDGSGDGFGSQFQTILNIFDVFCNREEELPQDVIDSLAAAFVPVMDAFYALEESLAAAGFYPCNDKPPAFFNNAPEIRLQAAGADGSNGIGEGILLRWLLNGELGDNHLPQGSYTNNQNTAAGFNQPDDYVYISRTPYTAPIVFFLDFGNYKPAINALAAKWTYILNIVRDDRKYSSIVSVYFKNPVAYLQQLKLIDPMVNPLDFMKGYTGELEILIQDKTAFGFSFAVKNNTNGSATLKLEALARPDDETTGEIPCLRDEITIAGTDSVKSYVNENIRRIRLLMDGHSYLQSFSFETYDDFLKSRPEQAWTDVGGGFALSLDDTVVFRQLEEPGRVDIDQRWPQYRDGTTLKVANYHDKWLSSTETEPSVKNTVQAYLTQSQDGEEATVTVNLSGREDDPGTSFRYLDLLNIQATDYHFARMLGLGYIDTPDMADPEMKFVYRMTYRNRSSASSAVSQLNYLGIPVGKADLRRPAKPLMRPVSYQIADTTNGSPGLFDEQGYSLLNHLRLVNIGRAPLEAEITDNEFFNGNVGNALFDHGLHTTPILFGIEYRSATQTDYVLPYITDSELAGKMYYAYNSAYQAAHGAAIPETVPLMDNDASLFIHLEKNPGVHYYAIYGIDLFARASALSDSVATDATVFPPDNQLKPPTDITVQYVQQESTLVFTSEREQQWLSGRIAAFPGMDTAFTRVTFNWTDITDVTGLDESSPDYLNAVIKGNQVGAFFKPDEPLQVSGIIRAVIEVDESTVRLLAGAYSLVNGIVQQPLIADEDLAKFSGSLLLTADGQYTVTGALNMPSGPGSPPVLAITVEKTRVTERVDGDPATSSNISTRSYYVSPSKDSRFTVMENLGNTDNWLPVQRRIGLIDHSNPVAPVIETVYDEQGNPSKFWVGGIHAQATVTIAKDANNVIMPGYYQILCDPGTILQPHPQHVPPYDAANPSLNSPAGSHEAYVEWYNGKVFLPLLTDPSEKKLVSVVAIKSSSPLILFAYDPGYLDVEGQVLSMETSQRIMTVNYHPGYRGYLLTEPSPGYLNRNKLLPAPGINDKKSLLALQILAQDEQGTSYQSAVSLPAILLALNIFQPLPPESPVAAGLKVRPDATGKAAFTFDIPVPAGVDQLRREPFGWSFYRTHNELVLLSLYLPATVTTILEALAGFKTDPFFADRYLGLLNLQFDPPGSGSFKQYPVTNSDDSGGLYGFPVPDIPELKKDKNGIDLPPGSSGLVANYEQAIHTTLLPLTEQVPVLAYIKTGKQTANKLPVIRDLNGILLDPGAPDFDPFPMIRQYPVNKPSNYYIRFTDYNLRGSARFLYFYAAAEVTNRLEIGALSNFAGPVTVLNTLPGEAPVIRSFVTGLNEGASDSKVTVTFKLSPFPAYDTITGVRIYRTIDPVKTELLSNMDNFLDVSLLSDPLTGGLTVTDDFSDSAVVPLGETVYYRLVFIRQIINELEQEENILSQGSEVIAVNLIDIFNPDAPDLSYNTALHQLQWQATANKGKYFLYQQNSKGNWQLVYQQENPDNIVMNFPIVLPGPDEDGNPVYSRFKVKAQNASGLFSLSDKEFTI
ncbi:hypothetical protein SAMN05216464_108161 [Mucilaginibacter pineti]|uniref:Uncharacterized protein n=1 Tax=Mucilaginibacter pineti TaxID=1391627 RepID=A0A1G7ETZ8_9SPHI|nr:hypothetical protein [Mucilaginibacter pineti]SDE67163.1 hypothetical protein SAMN05216464_108161 [Mucilaginibacter pineti]